MVRLMNRFEVDELRENVAGDVLVRDDPAYEEARTIFNAMVDRRPAVIVRCKGNADVAAALAFGRTADLDIAVRSGGHSVAGSSMIDDGLVIDLRPMNQAVVDREARTIRVGGGAIWADVDRACQPYGLVTTGGRVSTTGVAGLTLGGGSGWLERKLGFACDNLLEVELMTADGDLIRATEDENPELFWALHGGGGNFGVATSLTFRLHPVAATTLALLVFPPEAGPLVVRRYRELFEAGAPDELGGGILYLTGPEEPFVPSDLIDRLALAVVGVYAGDEDETRRVLRPIMELGPSGEMIEEEPYADIQSAIDDPPGFRNYWSAEHLHSLPDEAVDRFCARASDMVVPSPSQHVLFPWGGEVARRAHDWPIANRDVKWCVHPFGLWLDAADDARAIAWAKTIREDMAPFAAGGAYLNFTVDEGRERVVSGYGGSDNYRRLAAVKASLDPANVFRHNHNIEPIPA
jgi:FAD/FMN-containing dehydrogenase